MELEAATNGVEHAGSGSKAPEEYVGYAVLDPEGRKIGKVKEMFANAYGEPEYVRVRTGLLGARTILLPVSFVKIDQERRALTLQ